MWTVEFDPKAKIKRKIYSKRSKFEGSRHIFVCAQCNRHKGFILVFQLIPTTVFILNTIIFSFEAQRTWRLLSFVSLLETSAQINEGWNGIKVISDIIHGCKIENQSNWFHNYHRYQNYFILSHSYRNYITRSLRHSYNNGQKCLQHWLRKMQA